MLKSYDGYLQTGIPWAPSIPEGWNVTRNKVILSESKATVGVNHSAYTLLSLTKQGIIIRDVQSGKGKFPKDFESYKIVQPGQLVFCLFDIDETPRTVGLSRHHGMITGAYDVFNVSGVNSDYVNYYYTAIDDAKALKPLYTGLRKVINVPTFLQAKLPLPPRREQDQIVRYLDWKTGNIDRFIRAKRKEINRLFELANTRTKNAVLYGIQPGVPTKDSGIGWIGNIPAHWEVRMLFQEATEQSISNKAIQDKNLLSLSYGKIVNKDINKTNGLLPASFETYQVVSSGNIILRLTDLQNDKKSLRVGLVTQTGIITSAYTCLRPREHVLPHYLYLLLHSYDVCKVFYGMGGGVRQSIGYNEIRRMLLPLPGPDEQQAIVDYCYQLREQTDQMISALKREIELVNEYRTRLILDAVTGKVDVRDIDVPEYEADCAEAEGDIDDEEADEIDSEETTDEMEGDERAND